MSEPIWHLHLGDGPFVATAVHSGHDVRDEVAAIMALPEAGRLREEDPFTDRWTCVAPTRVIGLRSRFEVDLNRPPEKAVYRTPDDAWGLEVWKSPPTQAIVDRSMAQYESFYRSMGELFTEMAATHGRFLVFDLHSYNHRRDGAEGPLADPEANPQVNIGTGTMDRKRWAPLLDRFIGELGAAEVNGKPLDVRENVRFRGGYFPKWVHEKFPASGCCIAVEFKKFFMDEWTGQPDDAAIVAIGDALRSTVGGALEELARL